MEMNSFGEDLAVKTRKPYTITKQREKWTEEEHNRFLEALKLYGRAWQRIEEHIGTKTAIQIRSHAQKFFTKLEKEAVATGTPLGQARDIDIPPPRPKKKPNYPYPRKTGSCSISATTEAANKKTLKTSNPMSQEINKQEASLAAKSLQETEECSDETHCSVVLNLFQDAPSASIPSRDKGSKKKFSFSQHVPMATEPKEPPSLKGSSLTIEVNLESSLNEVTKSDKAPGRTSGINIELHELSAGSGAHKQAEKQSESDHKQGVQYHEGQEAKGMQTTCIENGGSPSCAFMNHTIPAVPAPAFVTSSAMSFISHPFPTFPPFAQDFYRSFLGFSSAFSSQIISTLQQNPTVHAAACTAAASLCPSEEVDSSSMSAIAAATVAAASAWWTTNGPFLFFPPIHASGFACSPPAISFPVVNTDQAPQEKMKEKQEECQNSASANQQAVLSSSSSSQLEEGEQKFSNNFKASSDVDVACRNLDRAKVSKPERSSCGSNTTSSSEIETDAVLKKNGETKDEEGNQSHFQNLAAGEINNRRARSNLCFNETWKEVSQEGRLAFEALFSREILPQSFATQLHKPEMGMPKENIPIRREETSNQNCCLPNEIKQGNLKVGRTGFKPYKRCSADVEVHKSSANDETSNKKIRLQGKVSS
ncbi:hypothetical protein KFK09_025617 [Dendrobium nobile]|uniref:LHY n=1 Tax=Dendrobium nobile TaxID=94219 RepID=A0A8T3A4B5_DENNO|nr:hypothetical protein KFK09_025617 [Dendrobium nobile]